MHIRRTALAAFLASTVLGAHAQVAPQPDPKEQIVTWSFSYTGFLDNETGFFMPDVRLAGKFVAQDFNRNDVIDMDELFAFEVDGREYVADSFCNTTRYLTCKLNSFSYDNGSLDFSVEWWGNDEAVSGWGGRVLAGQSYSSYSYRESETWTSSYSWTPQTRFMITPPPSPVPEPQMALMLGLGLLGLAGWKRLRAR
jgi:hypothetical protein